MLPDLVKTTDQPKITNMAIKSTFIMLAALLICAPANAQLVIEIEEATATRIDSTQPMTLSTWALLSERERQISIIAGFEGLLLASATPNNPPRFEAECLLRETPEILERKMLGLVSSVESEAFIDVLLALTGCLDTISARTSGPPVTENSRNIDPAGSEPSYLPITSKDEILATLLPSTIGVGEKPAAMPAPTPQDSFPLGYRHWTEASPEGRTVLGSAMIDGLKLSADFSPCDAIDGPSLVAGINEWMTNGDRSAAIMTVAAYISYSVCIITVPDPSTANTADALGQITTP